MNVLILYKWHLVAFSLCNMRKPRRAEPEENYKEFNMYDWVNLCKEYLSSQVKSSQQEEDKIQKEEKNIENTHLLSYI